MGHNQRLEQARRTRAYPPPYTETRTPGRQAASNFYSHSGESSLCMYVIVAREGRMYKLNFCSAFSSFSLAKWGCHENQDTLKTPKHLQ